MYGIVMIIYGILCGTGSLWFLSQGNTSGALVMALCAAGMWGTGIWLTGRYQ